MSRFRRCSDQRCVGTSARNSIFLRLCSRRLFLPGTSSETYLHSPFCEFFSGLPLHSTQGASTTSTEVHGVGIYRHWIHGKRRSRRNHHGFVRDRYWALVARWLRPTRVQQCCHMAVLPLAPGSSQAWSWCSADDRTWRVRAWIQFRQFFCPGPS